MEEFINSELSMHTLWDWGGASLLAVAVYTAFFMTKSFCRRWIKSKKNEQGDSAVYLQALLDSLKTPLPLLLAVIVGLEVVDFPPKGALLVSRIGVAILLFQVVLSANAMITKWVSLYKSRKLEGKEAVPPFIGAMSILVRTALYVVVVLVFLQNVGVEVTPLVAGLGLTGVAVALAVQNILGDVLAMLAIAFDKPFAIGDFIKVGDFMGVVERVGVKTTRIRSISGEEIIISNSQLLSEKIRNFRTLERRRVVLAIGVTYQTSQAKLEKIPSIIRESIAKTDTPEAKVEVERSNFTTFGDSSLNFETIYWVSSGDYIVFANIQEKVNLEIFRRFNEEKIDFAYPTQTIFLENDQS